MDLPTSVFTPDLDSQLIQEQECTCTQTERQVLLSTKLQTVQEKIHVLRWQMFIADSCITGLYLRSVKTGAPVLFSQTCCGKLYDSRSSWSCNTRRRCKRCAQAWCTERSKREDSPQSQCVPALTAKCGFVNALQDRPEATSQQRWWWRLQRTHWSPRCRSKRAITSPTRRGD
jgi:hypothetical protein